MSIFLSLHSLILPLWGRSLHGIIGWCMIISRGGVFLASKRCYTVFKNGMDFAFVPHYTRETLGLK